MKHMLTINGNHATVSLDGKIYAHDAGIIRDELLAAIEGGVTDISMELSRLEYIDSSGLGVLVMVHKRTLDKNGKLVLKGIQGMAAEILKRTRLDKVLHIE
ncbi:STAS domain-containing protein [Sporomusa sp. KB1]|jgi:anti-sigma B factor antagonist|uniref:STAS domain-containing protein n=1 Tax=Sporomusa sp. KB1 TaxID=943346 RepID=UPI0011A17294|nr:STAS domain-containing protein [Sporomusa sp. KB1]TWH44932.1 anti-sigma B factor antagonist [Sporomusa sp. KB1]